MALWRQYWVGLLLPLLPRPFVARYAGWRGSRASTAEKVFPDAGTAALANAALAGDAGRVHALIAEGAGLGVRSGDGVTLLQWALFRQSERAMATLLDAGADPSQPGWAGDTVVHMAAMAEDPSWLRMLLDHGADPDAPHGLTQAPPLAAALMNRQDAPVELLLAYHADPDRADRLGDTPLHVAAKVHKTHLLLRLLRAGADAGRRNRMGNTFQTYFNVLPAGGLSPEGRARREEVHHWLREHHIPVEQSTSDRS
jgi:ankyrin repeat protein